MFKRKNKARVSHKQLANMLHFAAHIGDTGHGPLSHVKYVPGFTAKEVKQGQLVSNNDEASNLN